MLELGRGNVGGCGCEERITSGGWDILKQPNDFTSLHEWRLGCNAIFYRYVQICTISILYNKV